MSQRITSQEKTSGADNIKVLLIRLREEFQFTNRAMAARLGVNENYLSRVFNGREKISPLFLSCVSMLLELETLKKEMVEVAAAKRAIQAIMAPSAAFVMNEPAKTAEVLQYPHHGGHQVPAEVSAENLKIADAIQRAEAGPGTVSYSGKAKRPLIVDPAAAVETVRRRTLARIKKAAKS